MHFRPVFVSFSCRISLALVAFLIGLASCRQPGAVETDASQPALDSAYWTQAAVGDLSQLIIDDIFTPPVASRVYVYATLAAYEATRWADSSIYASLTAQLEGFDAMPVPPADTAVHFGVAGVSALYHVAQALIYSKDSVKAYREAMERKLRQAGISERQLDASKAFGEATAQAVLARAARDGFKQTRGMPRYTTRQDSVSWTNTPPDYFDALEPYWNLIKPMVMDSASQFKPPPPPPYDMRPGARFHSELVEVYEASKNLTPEQKEIARFWDDNPATIEHSGHMMFANKKQSPVAHWMNITIVANRQAGHNQVQSARAFALAAIALFEAFISCWDEKYRSEYIRPVTAINHTIDRYWQPLLQTPPFPEYTSGHSVASSTVTRVLTSVFGENFAFTDDYEMPYIGIQRSFPSFDSASREACISRLYGGIHFRSAIEKGREQGLALGNYISEKLGLKASVQDRSRM